MFPMRMQFGRSIASFQTTKHKAADMLWMWSLPKPPGYSAASALDDDDADARAVASWQSRRVEAYIQTAVHAVQMHGGIGFTFDNDTHLWFKRAKQSEVFLGDANHAPRTYDAALGRRGMERNTEATSAPKSAPI